METDVKIQKLRENAILPTLGSAGAAGADLYACLEEDVTIAPGETKKITTGIATEFSPGIVALIFARSGLACKSGLAPANKVGVVDSDYRGEWMIFLHNHGNSPCCLHHGDRVAQVVFVPYFTPVFTEVDSLEDTARGGGGFGSTGR